MDAAEESGAGHPAAAANLDVIAAGEVERLVIDPPRHVEVHAADAVLVVWMPVHQPRNEPRDAGSGGVRQILADDAAGVAEALREFGRLRIEQDARGLA